MLSYRQPLNNKGKIIFDLGGYLSLGILGRYKEEWIEDGLFKIFSSHPKYGLNTANIFEDKTILIMLSVGYRFGK